MSDIRSSEEDGVLHIVLGRVAKRNALTAPMYAVLADLFTIANASDDIHAVVLSGDGSDFCAGNDLAEFLGDYDLAVGRPWRRFIDALPVMQKPVVACVQGNAVGIGMTMLLHFDIVYVEPSARLSVPFASLGVVPEAGSSGLLRDVVGPQIASEAFLLGRVFSGAEAVQLKLANAMVEEGKGRSVATDAARRIARLPRMAVASFMKLKRTRYRDVPERIEAECQAFMDCLRGGEARGIVAHLATGAHKRPSTSQKDRR